MSNRTERWVRGLTTAALIVALFICAVSMQGCAPSGDRTCREWVIERNQLTVETYHECKSMPNCELDRDDVWLYKKALQDLEKCKAEVPEVIIR